MSPSVKDQSIFSLDNMLIINVDVGFVLELTRLEGTGKVPESDRFKNVGANNCVKEASVI